jgi:molybdopterin molybdotransferase
MIAFEKAVEIVRTNAALLRAESVPLKECLNRVLRQDVLSDVDMPPFDKAAMDGYACRSQDVGDVLEVIEVIPAGKRPQRALGSHQCAKIMTGAMLPDGADCVIIVEETEEIAAHAIRFKGRLTAPNISRKASDVVAGQTLVRSGARIGATEIAALALAGCVWPRVSKKPRIGIIATGDEIVEPNVVPGLSQIRNSNACQLMAQCWQFGCAPVYYGIAKDAKDIIAGMLEKARRENDLILITGGVSMGDFDLVPSLLKESGIRIYFEKVAMQPGKPTVFGRTGEQAVFGLPGNPVSSFTVFETLVKEFLAAAMGLRNHVRTTRCRLANALKRENCARMAWVPVRISPEGFAVPVEYHGSAHITSMTCADGITSIPVGIYEVPEGSAVDVRQI